MNYEDFVEDFMKDLKQNMETDDVTLIRNEVTRENETRDAITVRFGDSVVAPVIYPRDHFAFYERGASVEEIADRATDSLRKAMDDAPEVPLLNRASAEKNLYCAVVNTKTNEELLGQVPHEVIAGDLAVIPRFRLSDESSFIVLNDLCGTLQMTPSEIMETAHRNTEDMGFYCRSMDEVLRSMMPEDFTPDMETPEAMVPDCGMYVCGNDINVDGAVCIASERFMGQVHQKLGEDFYILPSSRHEVIALPKSKAPDEGSLSNMIVEVNETQVSPEDVLSDHPYYYSAETRLISLGDQDIEKEPTPEVVKAQARAR